MASESREAAIERLLPFAERARGFSGCPGRAHVVRLNPPTTKQISVVVWDASDSAYRRMTLQPGERSSILSWNGIAPRCLQYRMISGDPPLWFLSRTSSNAYWQKGLVRRCKPIISCNSIFTCCICDLWATQGNNSAGIPPHKGPIGPGPMGHIKSPWGRAHGPMGPGPMGTWTHGPMGPRTAWSPEPGSGPRPPRGPGPSVSRALENDPLLSGKRMDTFSKNGTLKIGRAQN